jgi:hypothetical protein
MKNKARLGLIRSVAELYCGQVIRIHYPHKFLDTTVVRAEVDSLCFMGRSRVEKATYEELGIEPYPIGVWSDTYVTDRDVECECVKVFGG